VVAPARQKDTPKRQRTEDEGRLSPMESRAAAPLAQFEVGMPVRLHGLSREDLHEMVGVVVEDEQASARGRVAVELPRSFLPSVTHPVAVKPENCTIVPPAKQEALQDTSEAVGVVGDVKSPVAASSAADAVPRHSDEGSEEDAEEVADLDGLDSLLRRFGQQSIIKVYPDANNRSQLTVCLACGTSQVHRSRGKAAYYLGKSHFVPNGSPRKFR